MGKNQKNLSVSKSIWQSVEKILEDNREILALGYNVETVQDLFRYCCRLGVKELQQMIVEYRKAHKMTT